MGDSTELVQIAVPHLKHVLFSFLLNIGHWMFSISPPRRSSVYTNRHLVSLDDVGLPL